MTDTRTSPGSLPGWLLDEVANAGRENLDADHVLRYDAKEDAGAADEVRLLRGFGLNEQSSVVEFGAGTGQFTVAVASHCAHVVAVDVSPVMGSVLDRKLANTGLSNVQRVQSGFVSYEHHGPPADFVYSRFALHHIPDFWKAIALQRVRAILRPGAVLRLWDVVYNFEPSEAEERIEAWCATGGTNVDDEWLRWEIEEHVRDEHSTFTWVLEPMMERCGFAMERAEYSDDGFFAQYIARAI